jgi:hypothetical protein
MYRYTPRLMKEPYARGIFLNLMRVPIKEKEARQGDPLEIDADLDEDNDTGLALKIGGRGFMKGHTLQKELKDFKRRLQQLKGKNLVPYEAFISVSPPRAFDRIIKFTELFHLLDACTDEDLVDYLRPLIYLQWNKMYWIALLYMCVYWAYAAVCYAFYGFLYQSYALGAVLIGMSALFLAFECLTSSTSASALLRSPGTRRLDRLHWRHRDDTFALAFQRPDARLGCRQMRHDDRGVVESSDLVKSIQVCQISDHHGTSCLL